MPTERKPAGNYPLIIPHRFSFFFKHPLVLRQVPLTHEIDNVPNESIIQMKINNIDSTGVM